MNGKNSHIYTAVGNFQIVPSFGISQIMQIVNTGRQMKINRINFQYEINLQPANIYVPPTDITLQSVHLTIYQTGVPIGRTFEHGAITGTINTGNAVYLNYPGQYEFSSLFADNDLTFEVAVTNDDTVNTVTFLYSLMVETEFSRA